jgi:DNA-binding NtrC family response regulator
MELGAVPSVQEQHIRSVLCVPIGPSESPGGAIYADNRAVQGAFTKLDLWFLTALAQFIYVSYRNARDLELSAARFEMHQDELFRRHQIIGRSQVMLQAYERLRLAARREIPILLLGDSGTGKELFAIAAHQLSPRSGGPFVPVNIAGLSRELISSELFGHRKGAFTGATQDRRGRLELADGGTLFLDEVGEIPLDLQVMLLRALETKTFEPAGSSESIRVDFRLVCATNKDVGALIETGRFREDLYYRIAGVVIEMPPLSRRADDIPALVQHKLETMGSRKRFSPAAIERLMHYTWPGNVRELYRMVEAMDALFLHDEIGESDLPEVVREVESLPPTPNAGFAPLEEAVERFEQEHFRRAYAQANGSDEQVMLLLGLKKTTYYKKKRKYLALGE